MSTSPATISLFTVLFYLTTTLILWIRAKTQFHDAQTTRLKDYQAFCVHSRSALFPLLDPMMIVPASQIVQSQNIQATAIAYVLMGTTNRVIWETCRLTWNSTNTIENLPGTEQQVTYLLQHSKALQFHSHDAMHWT